MLVELKTAKPSHAPFKIEKNKRGRRVREPRQHFLVVFLAFFLAFFLAAIFKKIICKHTLKLFVF